jgi:hypothetical protein
LVCSPLVLLTLWRRLLLGLNPERPRDQRQFRWHLPERGHPLLWQRAMRLIFVLLRWRALLRSDLIEDHLLLPPELRLLPQPELIHGRRQSLEQLPEPVSHLPAAARRVELSEDTVVSLWAELLNLRRQHDRLERHQCL